MQGIDYKGINCSYDEKSDEWRAYPEPDLQWHDPSLPKLKNRIDKYLKSKSEYKDMPAILKEGWSKHRFEAVVITSASNESVWIKRKGNREKIGDPLCFYTDTALNHSLIAQYNETYAEVENLKKKMDEILSSMERVFQKPTD